MKGLALTGYHEVRLIRATPRVEIYEATRRSDGRAVIAKAFACSEDAEARVEHEFALLQGLQIEGVVRALELQRVGDLLVLISERVAWAELTRFMRGQPLGVDEFLALAIQLADVLAQVHERRVIHRDIRPTNLLIDRESGRVALAEFGMSVLLEQELRYIYDPEVLEGVLPYVSPEQTGRTGRSVDARGDLYSLGVVFYELLTGRKPFVAAAPLELIHAHLARVPEPLRQHRAELPEPLDRLVTTLLAKAPEHRYQTARGLVADLRALRDRLARGESADDFVLGREDFARELQLPHQLYGREVERQELVDELARTMQSGRPRIVLLVGPAGIGKSAMIAELEGEAARFGSYIARGRFDPTRDRPYIALIDAFAGLVEQLLTESESRLAHWRTRLSGALGGVAGVMIELIPNLALVLGEVGEPALLEPHEARNRVQLAVARFVSVFCDDHVSLVLALEDLQWADTSSLALLELMTRAERRSLFVLASKREGPLPAELASLPDTRVRVLELGPLANVALARLLADTLARPLPAVRRLTHLVARKTANNPLFIRQLLSHLAKQALLVPSERGWTWDDDAIAAAEIPDDVVDVMEAKLTALPSAARTLLQRAACIGDRFDLGTLKVVCAEPGATLTATLYDLVDAGLLNLDAGEYHFAHHGIREAALVGASAGLREQLRWRIGRHLLGTLDNEGSDRLFEVVDHLDAGYPAVRESADAQPTRAELASLNFRAGQRALDSAAYEVALHYLEQGIAMVEPKPTNPLVIDLHVARAQALALRGEVEPAERAFVELLTWPLRPRERAHVVARRIAQLTLRGRASEALDFGLVELAKLGWTGIARAPSSLRVAISLTWTWQRIQSFDSARLRAMPPCTDERANAALEILAPTKNAAYIVDSRLYVALVSLNVRRLLRHGGHPCASLALAQLATCVGSRLDEIAGAQWLGELAKALARRDGAPVQVRVDAAIELFVSPLGRSFAEPLARLPSLQARALEAGDFLWAGYAGALALAMQLEVGVHLRVLRRHADRFLAELGTRATREAITIATTLRALAVELTASDDAASSSDTHALLDPDPSGQASRYSLYVTLANQALVALVLGEPGRALGCCMPMIGDVEQVLFGSWLLPRIALTTLIAADMLLAAHEPLPRGWPSARRKVVAIVRRWAKRSQDNYAHYGAFSAGLLAGWQGRWPQAMQQLELARTRAAQQGARWIEALAAERLAVVAERAGLESLAQGARSQAERAYEAWGASAKQAQFVTQRELALALAHHDDSDSGLSRAGMTSGGAPRRRMGSGALDFDSVLESVAAIGSDLRIDQVIASVLDAAITNAGADHGMLVLEREGVQGVVARAQLDAEPEVLARPLPLADAQAQAPISVIHFVLRTEQALVLDDVAADSRFADDPYLREASVRSLLVMPILKAKRTLGALVLENRLSGQGFSPERLEVLQLIAGQAASAIDHARVHDALREGEARWRSLVAGAPDVIALLDEAGEIEFINRGMTKGDRDRFAVSPSVASWQAAVAQVLREGVTMEIELELPGDEGEATRWFVARLAPIEVERGDPGAATRLRKAIVIATDITARKQAEHEKRGFEDKLRQQQRLESIGTLAAGVAHEINNPIQGILNYAELIGENPGDAGLIGEFAAEITTESNRVAAIVRNLLAFSRHEGAQPLTEIDMRALIESTLMLIHAVMRKDQIQLRVTIDEGLPKVRCRPQQIQQIIMNLVTNARDALNQTNKQYDERWIEIRAVQREAAGRHWLRLTVEDSGPGIAADVLPHIFDPFFTTKGRDQGTGLGLSVSHGIAHEHGGELGVHSELGKGTRFHLDLPLDGSGVPLVVADQDSGVIAIA